MSARRTASGGRIESDPDPEARSEPLGIELAEVTDDALDAVDSAPRPHPALRGADPAVGDARAVRVAELGSEHARDASGVRRPGWWLAGGFAFFAASVASYFVFVRDAGDTPATSSSPPAVTSAPADAPIPRRELLWSKAVVSAGDGVVKALASSAERVFVGLDIPRKDAAGAPAPSLSARGRDGLVAALRLDAKIEWSTPFTTVARDVDVRAVATTGDAVWVLGFFDDELVAGDHRLAGAGAHALFLAELAARDGAVRSLRALGGPDAHFSTTGVVVSASERGVVLVGSFSGALDLGCGRRVATDVDPFVARFDARGACVWSPRMTGAGAQRIESVGEDALGDVVVAGTYADALHVEDATVSSSGRVDFVVMKFDPQGALAWSRSWGASGAAQRSAAIAVDEGGAIGFIGRFEGALDLGGGFVSPAGESDVLAAALDAGGKLLFARALGAPGGACVGDRCPDERLGVAIGARGAVSFVAPASSVATTSTRATGATVETYDAAGALVVVARPPEEQCGLSPGGYAIASDRREGLYFACSSTTDERVGDASSMVPSSRLLRWSEPGP